METTSSEARGGGLPERRATDEMRRLLDRAMAASANGIIITDSRLPDNPIVYVNPAFEKISRYGAEEVRGRNCRFLQGGDRGQPQIEELRAAIREERDCRIVLRNYRKDGTLFWNELYVSPVHDKNGRLTNFVGVQNDITERKRVEEALSESEERFRATFEYAAVGVAQVATDGQLLRVNRKLCEILGYTEEDLLQKNFREVNHPEDLEEGLSWVRRVLEGDVRTYSIEKRYIRKDGSEVWTNLTVSLVQEASGEPKYFIALIEDISQRKRTEEERDLLLVREQLARAEAVEARRRLDLLARSGSILSASLDYEATLEGITRLVVPDLADWCLVDVLEEDGYIHQLASAHAEEEKKSLLKDLKEYRRFGEDDAGSTAEVLRTGKSVLVSEIQQSLLSEGADEEHLKILRELGAYSILCVPLLARAKTLGAITLVSSNPGRRYDEEDFALAENLAYRCALAMDNARLHRERTNIARAFQRSLLPPHLPEIPGVEVGAEYLPLGEETEVGGDFYDLIDTDYDSWVCAIGDVRGKGAEAAAVTALARYTIRAVVLDRDTPSEILGVLNEAMLRQLPSDRFCTVACARLEPQDDSPGVGLTISRAGHPPPLLLHGDGSIEEIGCPGKALGVFPDAELTDARLRLMDGDTLVLYTDGITEARSPDGSFFGEERLRSLLRSCAGLGAPAIAERLQNGVLEFQEGYPHDDLAVLVLRVTG